MSKFVEDLAEALGKNGAKIVKDGESSYIDFGRGVTADIRAGTKIAEPGSDFLESLSKSITQDSKGFFKDIESSSGKVTEQERIAGRTSSGDIQHESGVDAGKVTANGAAKEAKKTTEGIFGANVTTFAGVAALAVTAAVGVGFACTNNVTVTIDSIDEDTIYYTYTPHGSCPKGTFRPRINDVVTFSFSGDTTLYRITDIDTDQVTVDGPDITATSGTMTVMTTLSHQATGTVGDITNYVVNAAESILSGGASILKWILIGLAIVIVLFMIIFVVIKKFV